MEGLGLIYIANIIWYIESRTKTVLSSRVSTVELNFLNFDFSISCRFAHNIERRWRGFSFPKSFDVESFAGWEICNEWLWRMVGKFLSLAFPDNNRTNPQKRWRFFLSRFSNKSRIKEIENFLPSHSNTSQKHIDCIILALSEWKVYNLIFHSHRPTSDNFPYQKFHYRPRAVHSLRQQNTGLCCVSSLVDPERNALFRI